MSSVIAPQPAGAAKGKKLCRTTAKDKRMKDILIKQQSSAQGPSRGRRPQKRHSETESSDDEELIPKSQLRMAQKKIRGLEQALQIERKTNRRLTNGLLQEIGRTLCTVVTSQTSAASAYKIN